MLLIAVAQMTSKFFIPHVPFLATRRRNSLVARFSPPWAWKIHRNTTGRLQKRNNTFVFLWANLVVLGEFNFFKKIGLYILVNLLSGNWCIFFFKLCRKKTLVKREEAVPCQCFTFGSSQGIVFLQQVVTWWFGILLLVLFWCDRVVFPHTAPGYQ